MSLKILHNYRMKLRAERDAQPVGTAERKCLQRRYEQARMRYYLAVYGGSTS